MISFLRAYKNYDPAAKSIFEVFLLYPGVKAVGLHHVAHALHRAGIPFFPRLICEFSRWLTGIEIHPGAVVGKHLIIDHGMGVVIGETTVIGDHVLIYQGVTLGGTSLARTKRHPTIENHVVIGAGAKVLGNIVIGEGSRIGSNSVVVDPVPPHSTVVGIPGRVIAQAGVKAGEELNHNLIKEPPQENPKQ